MEIIISDKKKAKRSQIMIGAFFEDINYGADGGLYAEMIENRSFEFWDAYGDKYDYFITYDGGYGWFPLEGQQAESMQYVSGSPVSDENPHYLRFTANREGEGFYNKAYDGITMVSGEQYKVSFYARIVRYQGTLTVSIQKDGYKYASETITLNHEDIAGKWKKMEVVLTASRSVRGAEFVIILDRPGVVEFDFVSMIPCNAVAGIFRKDLFEKIFDLKPGFIRFPGGCIVEGNTISNRYRFKDTLRRPEDRKNNWNRWAVAAEGPERNTHSPYSHYNQSLGLGYYEYFLLCELTGAEAIPVMNVGLACQFQSREKFEIDTPEFRELLQDAIDLIEFANGEIDTKWGRIRSELGHPQPFRLKMLAIGNEQWETETSQFFERYKRFEKKNT